METKLVSLTAPSFAAGFRSKLVQSNRPSSNSLAESVTSSVGAADSRVATETAYSRRDGIHGSVAVAPGSLSSVSYQVSHALATCWTFATSVALI